VRIRYGDFCAPHLLSYFPDSQMASLDNIGGEECLESRNAKFAFRCDTEPGTAFFRQFELLNDGYDREKRDDGRFLVFPQKPPYNKGFVKID